MVSGLENSGRWEYGVDRTGFVSIAVAQSRLYDFGFKGDILNPIFEIEIPLSFGGRSAEKVMEGFDVS